MTKQETERPFHTPQITSVDPVAALPGGEIGVHGAGLGPYANHQPVAMVGDLAATVLATAAMTAALLPLRGQPPGVLILVAQVGFGILVYGALVAALDIAGLRSLLVERLAPLGTRVRAT